MPKAKKKEPTAMSRWMTKATPAEKKLLAKAAKTSVAHLRHLGQGRRRIMAGLAQKLAKGSHALHKRTLYLDQRQLCEDCARCPLVTPKRKRVRTPKKEAA